ncbi:MAG: aldehyde dehydrogenase family protein [Bacteroidota bacterium]|nr:aldehyde dehydrogenase family protein [Bacteroidota bacterium]
MNSAKPFFIGGEQRKTDVLSSIKNPFDGKEVAHIHLAEPADINEAIQSAVGSFKVTSQYSGFERSQILSSIARSIQVRKEEFAQLITAEAGKPIKLSRAEVDRAIATFEIAAEESKRVVGEVLPLDITAITKGKQGIVQRFPIGVIACISPFNFPLNLVAHKIAPAIASGNTFVLKPPPQTPLTSLLLAECLLESGLDKRTVNVIPCSNEDTEILVTDERIAMLSFTGSAKVGWMLKQKAGKKKVVLELGGNAAVIVDKSADIDLAAVRCVLGGFGYAGQVCIKVQRILLHKEIEQQFTEKFLVAVAKIKSGNPKDEDVLVGPMISETEAVRVESWVNEAVQHGAKVLGGGKRNGVFYEPTVLTNVNQSMRVCSEEIFGPVVTLQSFSSIEEAVAEVNRSRYGLQAGIFSNEFNNIQFAYKHLNVGGVIVNDYPTFRVDNMPYGGVKDSGFGREGIKYAMQEMTEPKLMVY